ncbi:MAG: hypothetical protein IID00_07085 [Chloroflexi bacterium]|nr:hypothetical protein [Chloroflexota bacterium]
MTVTSGTLDLNGKNVTVNDILTISNGATLQLEGGETVTTTTTTLSSGSTVTYDATSGTRDIKDYSYHHLTINGSGGTFLLLLRRLAPDRLPQLALYVPWVVVLRQNLGFSNLQLQL